MTDVLDDFGPRRAIRCLNGATLFVVRNLGKSMSCFAFRWNSLLCFVEIVFVFRLPLNYAM